jgi:hypothetical protein
MPVRPLPAWPTGRPLRAWQEAAAAAVLAHPQRSFLASATPAAGKTTFGLHVAHRMLSERRVGRVCIVAPTTHIARQWAADAARYGLDVEPNRPNASPSGWAVCRALRAGYPHAARADEPPLPRLRPASQAARDADRGGAQPRARPGGRGRGGGRAARARGGERGVPRPVVERAPRRRRAAHDRARQGAAAVRGRRARARARLFTTTTVAPSRAAEESAHERRERLRDERRTLVAAVSRRTGEAHRAIHGRINRETGAPSVTDASVEQLERGNRLLERQANRRR